MTSNNNNNGIEGLTPEMIAAAVNNPGSTVSAGDLYESATQVTPKVSHQISGYGKDLRPRAGREDGAPLVSNVSPSFGKRLGDEAIEFRNQERRRAEAAAADKELLQPYAIRRDVEALRRALKRAEKRIAELENNNA